MKLDRVAQVGYQLTQAKENLEKRGEKQQGWGEGKIRRVATPTSKTCLVPSNRICNASLPWGPEANNWWTEI